MSFLEDVRDRQKQGEGVDEKEIAIALQAYKALNIHKPDKPEEDEEATLKAIGSKVLEEFVRNHREADGSPT